eukprot:CCRYP_012092-RB/>CCRYP_012092-RB protein AED:0.26 eAED:0.26 QI:94/1/1/1/1/1/2/1607/402
MAAIRWRRGKFAMATIVSLAVVDFFVAIKDPFFSPNHFSLSSDAPAEVHGSDVQAHHRSTNNGTRDENQQTQGELRKSTGTEKIMNKKKWSDLYAKSNSSSHDNSVIMNKTFFDNTTKLNNELVLPNILLIGAQKAGTTTVASWLHRNGVCAAKVFGDDPSFYEKEVHFFDKFYDKGIEYYVKRFKHCTEGVYHKGFSLDATPNYLNLARRVYDTYSNKNVPANIMGRLKLMVILREPISRELSWYNHKVSLFRAGRRVGYCMDVSHENGTVKSFDEYADELKERLLDRPHNAFGFYVDHLRTWVTLFDRQQLLILSYDELLRDPSTAKLRIGTFLGMSMKGEFGNANTKASNYKVKEMSPHSRKVLEPLFRKKNEEFYDFIRDHPGPPMEQTPFPRFDNVV